MEFELREPPDVLTYSLSASGGANSQTTFQEFNRYDGSSRADWVTLGARARTPPSSLPDGSLGTLSDPERYRLAREFRNFWEIDRYDAPPDFGAKLSVGNTVGPVGFLLAGLYKNDWRARNELSKTLRNTGTPEKPDPDVKDSFPDSERDASPPASPAS
jgi:hypothetical protein